MGFFGDLWDGVKNVANDLNPVEKAKNFFKNPVSGLADIATTYNPITMPFKEGLKFAEGDTSGKKWEDLNPFQKMSIGIQSKGEGIINTPAKWLGLDVDSPMQDLMTRLKHERLDDALGNLITGLSTGAGQKDQGDQEMAAGGMGGSPGEGSLGRPLGLEEDPVLNQPTENYNNFSF